MAGTIRQGALRRTVRVLGRVLLAGGVIWATTFGAVVIGTVVLSRQTALPAPADAIICLGAGMSQTAGWEAPDAASARRALTCARLHAAGVAPVVVFTGYGNEVLSAAEAMFATALRTGLPPAAGRVEAHALSTIQNADFSLALLPDAERVVLVSDAFHLPRSWLIFRLFGVPSVAVHASDADAAAAASAENLGGRSQLQWILRESLAIWFNAARGAAYVLAGLAGIDRETRIAWFN